LLCFHTPIGWSGLASQIHCCDPGLLLRPVLGPKPAPHDAVKERPGSTLAGIVALPLMAS